MCRAIKIGIALLTLLAVAVIFIAPTIDLPETVLREHQPLPHLVAGAHAFVKVAAEIAPAFTFAMEERALPRGIARLDLPLNILRNSLLSMRC